MEIQASISVASMSASVSKQSLGAEVVSQTLGFMNKADSVKSANASYDFQTKVLSGAMSGAAGSGAANADTGTIINIIA